MVNKKRNRTKFLEDKKITKQEESIAKFLHFNVKTKEYYMLKISGRTYLGFTAKDMIDKLLELKWNKKSPLVFQSRQSCIHFCQTLLEKGFFHRVEKCRSIKKKEEPSGEIEKKKTEDKDLDQIERKKNIKKKNRRKKFVLEHEEQIFKDGENLYIWFFDPISLKSWIFGSLILVGAISACLFPLWPPKIRDGAYYLSLAGTCFVGLLFVLYFVRSIIFIIVWSLTFGKQHFWIFPNLTEDCGFVESFIPIYSYNKIKSDSKTEDKVK